MNPSYPAPSAEPVCSRPVDAMTKLSAAAQAVLDVAYALPLKNGQPHLAAALRAAADQVVPRPPKNWEFISCVSARELEIRNQLLVIVNELEANAQ